MQMASRLSFSTEAAVGIEADVVQVPIQFAALQQFSVRADIDKFVIMQQQYRVALPERQEAMR